MSPYSTYSRLTPSLTSLVSQLPLHFFSCSGQVFAGEIGSEDRSDYVYVGDVVNTAARLSGIACREVAAAMTRGVARAAALQRGNPRPADVYVCRHD